MGALAEFAITEQYKGLIHHLLTSLFTGIETDDYEEITERVLEKLETLDDLKQFILQNYNGPEDTLEVMDNALQFVLIVENVLLVKELEG